MSSILNELNNARNIRHLEEEEGDAGAPTQIEAPDRLEDILTDFLNDEEPARLDNYSISSSMFSATPPVPSNTSIEEGEKVDALPQQEIIDRLEDTQSGLSNNEESEELSDFLKNSAIPLPTPSIFPHGLTVCVYKDGTIIKTAYNGWTSYQIPGTAEHWMYTRLLFQIASPKEEWYEYSNGTREKFDIDGRMIQCFSNGIRSIRSPDGTLTYDYPHSVRRTYYLDGSLKEFFPNGWICITDIDKSEKWTYDSCYDTQAEEERVCHYNGLTERILSDGHIEWILKNQSVLVRHMASRSESSAHSQKNSRKASSNKINRKTLQKRRKTGGEE